MSENEKFDPADLNSTGDRDVNYESTSISGTDNRSRFKEIREVLHKYKVITRGVSPKKLRMILEDLGPAYVKLGQIMSLHSDILPKRYCDELLKLNTYVRPMPFSDVCDVLNNSYRGDWREIFQEIDETPIGSASIAQVHKAKLKDKSPVVIKIERKGIYDTMARDIRLLHKAVKLLPPVPNLKNLVDLDMVLDEMWTVAQQEMDFLKEASNMEEFERLNADIRYIYVPRLYREYTTSRVLVMEYIDGVRIDQVDELRDKGYSPDEIGRKFVNNFIKQVMDDGFFHADPHPGNVMIRDGKIVWLDMGMMGRLSERDRRIMMKAVRAIGMHDVSGVTDAVLELGDFWRKPDRDQLNDDIRDFLDTYGSASMGDLDIGETLSELLEIMKKNFVGIPHGMTMLVRGLSHMEGVLANISPDINMMEIAARRVSEEWLSDVNWKEEIKKGARKAYLSINRGIEIPVLLSDALKDFSRGRSHLKLELEPTHDLNELVHYAIRNLMIGFCITALLISSSILCMTDMKPKIMGIPVLGFFGYLVAAIAVLLILMRYLLRKIREYRKRRNKKKINRRK
ncbi:MAG: lipopolysaccharide core heptose(II) kinase RfaY [Lachnospiraceae bacterium]|nr:lipopolysaccharide core heptose(II) kinase RfaY [Lachnospiraceae bacterium]